MSGISPKPPRIFPKTWLRNDHVWGTAVALLALFVYLATVAPSIGYWDSAELAASGATLGIAHPTGYPFFMLLSRAFVVAVPLETPYSSLNLMVACLTALSVYLFFALCLRLLSSGGRAVFGGRASPGGLDEGLYQAGSTQTPGVFLAPHFAPRCAAAVAALVFAFSRIVWSQGVSLEVYALHLVFFLGVTLLFLRALDQPEARPRWLLFAFALGLSFSHHMMMVLLAPAFLYLFFSINGFGRAAWGRIARAIPVFALGLTPYLYFPLRAATSPIVNWGDPSTLDRFWAHVSAAQYRFKMFSSFDIAVEKLMTFLRDLPMDFTVLPLCFAVLGLWAMLRRGGRLLPFTLLLFATCVLYAVNYDFDDANFYLQAHAVVALWAAFGMHAVLVRLFSTPGHVSSRRRFRGLARWAVIVAYLLAVLMPFDANYRVSDRSADHAVEDYARTVLDQVEPDALVLSGDLEGFILGARYLQTVEGVRPDVALVGLGILAFPWYQTELETAYPGLLAGTARERIAYGRARADFERTGEPTHAYNLAYTNFVRALLREHVGHRPVYASFVPGEFFKGYRVTPQGLLVRITPPADLTGEAPPASPPPSLPARPIPNALPYAAKVNAGYAAGFMAHAFDRAIRGERAEAARLLRIVLELDAENEQARDALTRLGP